MHSNVVTPSPIFDNLEHIGNPFKQNNFSTQRYVSTLVAGSEVDFEYALKFLFSYNGSSATFNSYRRDVERLLQWAWLIEKTSITNLKRQQIEEFFQFNITPPKEWIGHKNVARYKTIGDERLPNDEWKPYVNQKKLSDYIPSQATLKASFTALSSFYEFLVEENIVEYNPVALIKQKSKFLQREQSAPPVRRISNLQWDYVLETAEIMAEQQPKEHERTLFIMNALYSMYLRISELVADERATPVMGDFKRDLDKNWWFHVRGKGNKTRKITVCNDMLSALKRYREYLTLSPYPTSNDLTPLLKKSKGKGGITSTRHVRRIVQLCFDTAYERMKEDNLKDDAFELQQATVHWLRHTGISEDVKHRPREHVRDDAGHCSMATTDRYIDSDMRERHASGKKKLVKNY